MKYESIEVRTCPECKKEKIVHEFPYRTRYPSPLCKICSLNKKRSKENPKLMNLTFGSDSRFKY